MQQHTHTRSSVRLGALGIAFLAVGGVLGNFTPTPPDSTYFADGPSYNTVSELTNASQSVAHVRVVAVGASYRVPFDAPVVHVAPHEASGAKAGVPPPPPSSKSRPPQLGLLRTDATVEVVEPIKSSSFRTGDRIVVSQLGGTDEHGAKISTEHDPLLRIGEQEILFLSAPAGSSKFATTGGGQGRFKLINNGLTAAVDDSTPIARQHNGKPADFLKSVVRQSELSQSTPD